MADLLTLNELKGMLGIDPTDTRKDAMYTALLPAASSAVRSYAQRDFGASQVTEERPFEYDGSGYLDIDDASVITQVSQVVPHGTDFVLNTDDWYAMPFRRDDSPVFYYILLSGPLGTFGSPEMGFTRNLDVLYAEGRLRALPSTVKVTATWGWPSIPDDVKLATLWTIVDWTSRPTGGEGLTAEAIEGYSRAWGAKSAGGIQWMAVPNRARDLLANYMKINV